MRYESDVIDRDVVAPSLEMGAFEALWATEISSFKQLRDRLARSDGGLLSSIVDRDVAQTFYHRAVELLRSRGVEQFGTRFEGTMDYPDKLADADYPVTMLYFQGNWDLVYERGIAVVGTRRATESGIKRTRRLVRALVEQGYTIFSGLATGIDAAAHGAALASGGNTVAIMGTPIWFQYPECNRELYRVIARDHLLVSQVPVVSYRGRGIAFNRQFFPERNKTMAALTEATIIVEAGETSGTLVQANAALKQGRKVFILNNNFDNPSLSWPRRLEKLGAIRVHDVAQIVEVLS